MFRPIRKFHFSVILSILWLLSSSSLVFSQGYLRGADTLDIYEPGTENGFLPGARAAAMGGAQIAAGSDGSALWYNPALLTRIRNMEFGGILTHQRLKNETSIYAIPTPSAKLSNTRFGGLWAIIPVPTERGGMSLGASVNRVRSFDRILRFGSSQAWSNNPTGVTGWGGGEDESGNLWAWSFGGGIEISPKMSVGISLDIYDGTDDYSLFFDSTDVGSAFAARYSKYISSSYTGITGKTGFSYNAANWLTIGGIVGFPTSMSIDQTVDILDQFSDSEDHFLSSYRYTLPFWFGLGGMVNYNDLTVTGDIKYNDYSQLQYRRGQPDLAYANQLVMKYYRDIFDYHIGAEYVIRPSDISLRAGYYLQPIPFKGFPVTSDPHFFTFGAGFLVDKTINFDLTFVTGSWERTDYTKTYPSQPILAKYSANRFMATVAYRFQ